MSTLGWTLLTGYPLPQSVQIHGAEGTVVEAIAGLTAFAPDHATVVGADWAVESSAMECGQHRAHVDITVIRGMRRFLEGSHAGAPDVAAVREVNSFSSADA